jgi:hypothetical protein
MRVLWEVADFVRKLRRQMRFGELSRAPLELLRLELRGQRAECEWMARPADRWDEMLPPGLSERNASAQALEDAVAVRELLFSALPELESAAIRVFRNSEDEEDPELIIAGTVCREDEVAPTIRSLAMKAKLLGFQFSMDDGVLGALQSEEHAMSS